jgi:hypothetical protein
MFFQDEKMVQEKKCLIKLNYIFLYCTPGPFTLDSHIHAKALKMHGFPKN